MKALTKELKEMVLASGSTLMELPGVEPRRDVVCKTCPARPAPAPENADAASGVLRSGSGPDWPD